MLSNTLDQLQADLSAVLPEPLVSALIAAYREIRENFYLGKYEPAELNAGKLCEIVYRIMEFESTKKYTPLGQEIHNLGDKFRAIENRTNLNNSLRIHIPRVASALYNIRNNRGVGHAAADVNPNVADSTLVAAGADWILAELVRVYYRCSLEEAQRIVNRLVQMKLPIISEVAGKKRVLNPNLKAAEQVLVILVGEFPSGVEDRTLSDWVGYSNVSVFKESVLLPLHKKRLIEYSGSVCIALPTALKVVADNYQSWMNFKPSALIVTSKKAKMV